MDCMITNDVVNQKIDSLPMVDSVLTSKDQKIDQVINNVITNRIRNLQDERMKGRFFSKAIFH